MDAWLMVGNMHQVIQIRYIYIFTRYIYGIYTVCSFLQC